MIVDVKTDGSNYPSPSDELRDSFKSKYNGYGIKDIAIAFKELKEQHEIERAKAAKIFHEWNYVRFLMVPLMDDFGMTTAKLEGIGRVEQRHDMSCKQLDTEALIKWMKDTGHEEMTSEIVNSSSLKSFLKNQIVAGEDLPPDDMVKITPFSYGTVVKA